LAGATPAREDVGGYALGGSKLDARRDVRGARAEGKTMLSAYRVQRRRDRRHGRAWQSRESHAALKGVRI
jgi:hypothetical protein